MATTVGEIQLLATINTARYKQDAKTIQKTNDGIATSSENVSKRGNAAFSSLAKVGMGGLIAATAAVGAAIIGNIGGAIKRIDTLVAFPRVLQSLGASSDAAKKSTDKLSKSLQGLPTSLSDGAAGVQQLVTSGLSAEKATDAFLAVNNALLVSGQGTAQVQAAFMQLNQALSRGSIQGQEWNTIASSMPTVLQALGKETGKSKEELRKMFRENPQKLLDNIIRLNKQGGGGLASLDKQARQATGGIGTSFANMNNSIQRGMQGIVEAIGGGDLTKGQEKISGAITEVGKAFGKALELMEPLFVFIIENKGAVVALAGVFSGLLLAGIIGVASAISGPMLIGMGILTAFGALAGVIVQNWGTIKSFFQDIFETLKNTWNDAKQKAVETWQAIRDEFINAFNKIKGFIDEHITAIKNIAIVITSLLLPKIAQMGTQYAIAATKATVSWVVASARMVVANTLAGAAAIWNALKSSAAWVLAAVKTAAAWGLALARMTVGFIIAGTQALIAAGKVAASWMLALGPIGLIVSLFIGLTALIIANWDAVKSFFVKAWDVMKTAVSTAFNWVKKNWPLLLAIITGPIGLAVYTIVRNFDTIKAAVQKVWNWITGAFDKIAAIGTSILKGAVNSVLGFAERTINGFIRLINSALGAINKIPGVNIGSISELHIPKLAEGGIVTAPTLAMIGEGRESEAVIPLSKLDQMTNGKGTTVNQTNNIYNEVDMDRALRELAWRVTY